MMSEVWQVASFSPATHPPRNNSSGAHAGLHNFRSTFFLGIFWALWDEDQ